MTKTKILVPTLLAAIFSAPGDWKQVDKYLYHNGVAEIGAALATKSPSFSSFALNKGEYERAIAAERDGKIKEAWVVAFRLNTSGPPTYVGAVRAASLAPKLEGRPTRDGKYGPFWILEEYEFDSEAPF